MSASISKKARAPSFWDWDGVARSPVGSGLLDIKGVEHGNLEAEGNLTPICGGHFLCWK